jgi:hypothetical protein
MLRIISFLDFAHCPLQVHGRQRYVEFTKFTGFQGGFNTNFPLSLITPRFDDGTRWTNMTQRNSQERRHNGDILVVVFSSSNSPSHLPSAPHGGLLLHPPSFFSSSFPGAIDPSQGLCLYKTQHKHGKHADKYACPGSNSKPLSRQPSGGRLDALGLGATVTGMFSISFYHISLEDSHFTLNPSIAHQHFRDL